MIRPQHQAMQIPKRSGCISTQNKTVMTYHCGQKFASQRGNGITMSMKASAREVKINRPLTRLLAIMARRWRPRAVSARRAPVQAGQWLPARDCPAEHAAQAAGARRAALLHRD